MILRPMNENDICEISQIERYCFSEPTSEEALRLYIDNENMKALVLSSEQGVLAYCSFVAVCGEIQIVNLATHPDARRRGYARKLLCGLIEGYKKYGFTSFSLEVRESNTAAISLYGSLGFRTVGSRVNFYKNPTENALLMELIFNEF